jgi:hypothetical protein
MCEFFTSCSCAFDSALVCRVIPTFRSNMLPPSLWSNTTSECNCKITRCSARSPVGVTEGRKLKIDNFRNARRTCTSDAFAQLLSLDLKFVNACQKNTEQSSTHYKRYTYLSNRFANDHRQYICKITIYILQYKHRLYYHKVHRKLKTRSC